MCMGGVLGYSFWAMRLFCLLVWVLCRAGLAGREEGGCGEGGE